MDDDKGLVPYRTMEIILGKPRIGLIPAEKPVKPRTHECDTPYVGPFRWFLFWLPTIREGSHFRCHCGQVYQVQRIMFGPEMQIGSCLMWIKHPFEKWLEAGGQK